mgnify:CR=1 FL=1
MKIIGMLFLIVLLWGGEAEAFVDEYGNCTLYIEGVPHGCTYSQLRATALHDGKRIGDVATCLAVMEAAMRAMDEFVPKRHPTSFISDNTLLYTECDDACIERRSIESAEGHLAEVKREQAAITQWDETRKNCWGKP